jgi:DNA (cytosine-5)-methyltransferase 1
MISVNHIQNKAEKAFFIEKAQIYVRLVECYAQKKSLFIESVTINDEISKELICIGFIEKRDDLENLKKTLKKDLFARLVSCVFFALNNSYGLKNILSKLRNVSRQKMQVQEHHRVAPTVVDFFCGAGGLSYGFKRAGYKILLANDIQDVCCATYRYNHPEMPEEAVVQGDIKEIINHINKYIHEDVDVVIGGPPCQGFSSVNQQRVIDDPRNKLYKYYIEAVRTIVPKIVIMENVRGMLTVADQVVEDYGNIEAFKDGIRYHYIASYRLLDSQYFYVAQSRVRLIYIAIRNDIAERFQITPNDIYNKIEKSCKNNKIYNLSDALQYIKPLESPRIKNLTEVDDEKTGKKIDVNEFKGTDNDYLKKINENHTIPFVFNHKARYASAINYEIFKKLDQGEDGTSKKIAGLMPYERRKNIFKDKYYKLIADKPCKTITAHLRMDCLSHIHPYQVRTITPREAARIQSFPDDYLFLGTYLKTYMQIGNAVPPLMANQIAKSILKYIM